MAMATIFERIVSGEVPCFKVWEDSNHLAFLDIRPVAPGHTLLIPKKAVDPVFSMDPGSYRQLMEVAKVVADLLKAKIPCQRICMAVVGFEVPHAHIHLIPARSLMDFPWPGGQAASPEALTLVQKQIVGA